MSATRGSTNLPATFSIRIYDIASSTSLTLNLISICLRWLGKRISGCVRWRPTEQLQTRLDSGQPGKAVAELLRDLLVGRVRYDWVQYAKSRASKRRHLC